MIVAVAMEVSTGPKYQHKHTHAHDLFDPGEDDNNSGNGGLAV